MRSSMIIRLCDQNDIAGGPRQRRLSDTPIPTFRMRLTIIVAFACFALVLCVGTSQTSPQEPVPTSICAILSQPTDWDNKIVSLSAAYYDDEINGAVLADDHCDKGAIELVFPWNSPAKEPLKAALSKDSRGNFGSSVTGTWVGRFHSDYGKFHDMFLEATAVSDLALFPIDFSTGDASPISTTIEEILKRPKESSHKTVVFRSQFESDGMHGSWVSYCESERVGHGIIIRTFEGANGEKALDKARHHGSPGTIDKTIWAEWTGRLVWFPRAKPASGFYEIQIIGIRNLTFTMHPDAYACEIQPAPTPSSHP
jgi:hypothetical protein